jgi:hypothetical protein
MLRSLSRLSLLRQGIRINGNRVCSNAMTRQMQRRCVTALLCHQTQATTSAPTYHKTHRCFADQPTSNDSHSNHHQLLDADDDDIDGNDDDDGGDDELFPKIDIDASLAPPQVVELNSIGQRYLECNMKLESDGAFRFALAILRSLYTPQQSKATSPSSSSSPSPSNVTVYDVDTSALHDSARFPTVILRHPQDGLAAATILWFVPTARLR